MTDRQVKRVLVVVFDGLRPDMIAGRMPRLAAFGAEDAVTFAGARSVFPSHTRVATSSTATGTWPRRHGLIANSFHVPGLRAAPFDTGRPDELVALADGGAILQAPGLGARLADAGLHMAAAHCGTAGAARLLNDAAGTRDGAWTFTPHGRDQSATPEAVDSAVAALGALPEGDEMPKLAATGFAASVANTLALVPGGPEMVFVWLPEPDSSFHYREIGSPASDSAQTAADKAFASLMEAVGDDPGTAVIAMSDHGQITISDHWDIDTALRADGLSGPREAPRLLLTHGASGELRLRDDDPALRAEVAAWLMARPEIGMVFARDDVASSLDGVLPLSLVHLDHPRAPDLVYVTATDDAENAHGVPGRALVTGGPPVGGGVHGGLHPHELSTVLMIAAPGAAAGMRDDRACGLIDVAPTVLSLLGLPVDGMDGAPLPLDAGPSDCTLESHEARAGAFGQRLTRRGKPGRMFLHAGGRG